MLAPRKTPAVFVFPCGCIAEGTRANRVQQCDGKRCQFTPTKPANSTTYRGGRR